MSKDGSLDSLGPFDSLQLDSDLSLHPRIKLLLTIFRADKSVNPIDEWKIKRSLIEYLKSSHSIEVEDEKDVDIRKFKDLKKRKREDPVARGALVIRDLGFLSRLKNEDDVEKKFFEWRKNFVAKMDGMELNLEGSKFKLGAVLPPSDDFEAMRKEWEENLAFGNRGHNRGGRQPDTLVLRGVPSRWFAETRVSSKPSMLVTHTIFSALGKIRNLDVAEDNDISLDADDDGEEIVSGLLCKIVVRYETYKDFHDALKILSGHSLQKQGSRLKADYEVTWDRDGFFQNGRTRTEGRSRWEPTNGSGRRYYNATQYNPDEARPKRFRE
ncbi:OLC1v1017049C2 [Oldenlandia corymbosa var. corymbosa]|uniref:OLC1v1017049C2 n=1 Tax=Oldenlandia corymbosa var. corymbosa TaxID=529605 RepID=A0AAV1E8K4_OLDCO|nr:OLC1v1017049C2 [Oldenlandia corymbosa var. corymbosa]